MKHTFETALARAVRAGYVGEYAQLKALDWMGRTDGEIRAEADGFNQDYQRRQRYARAAAIETEPKRRAHLDREAKGNQ